MLLTEVFFVTMLCIAVQAQASSDDRFIKKYAMMKIYESCFGPEVVKQIRQEMKEAYAKCSAAPSYDVPQNQQGGGVPGMIPSMFLGKLPPGFAIDPNSQTITKPGDNLQSPDDMENNQDLQGPHKLQNNILAFRPHGPPYPQQNQQSVPPYIMAGSNPQFRPFSPATPFYQFPSYTSPGLFYPPAMQYNPYGQYPAPYQQQGYYQQPYMTNNRMSRDMDLRDRLDLVSRGSSGGRVKNITCVMQELGYIDHNLEPNYEKITERITNLPVSSELKGDIQDGLQFCQKFSKCVPDVKKDVAPLSQELIKPMFFFRCYKHKKLEACIMKDIRERFTSEDELDTDSDFRSLSRSGRSIREDPLGDPRFEALDEMAVYLYDFLSGANSFDFDLYM